MAGMLLRGDQDMKKLHQQDYVLYLVPVFFLVLYLTYGWYATQDASYHFGTVIQAEKVWGLDDGYRYLLASMPFSQLGAWFWDYYLPINLLFDGTFSKLTGHNEFWMRVPRVLFFIAGLMLVLRAGRHLGVSPIWLVLSSLMLLMMPLNVLLSMSFYGETLLAGVMGFVVYALVTNKQTMQVFLAALMPFIRPEGAFYLGLMAIQKALLRRWGQAILMLLPALLYAAAVLFLFRFSLDGFFVARNALSAHYPLLPQELSSMGFSSRPYYTVNLFWWVTGLLGACLPRMRNLWPLYASVLLVMLFWLWQAWTGSARGEARYFYSAFPLFVLSQAVLLDTLYRCVRVQWRKKVGAAAVILVILITLENIAQIDPLRHHHMDDRRWPLAGEQHSMPVLYREEKDIVAWKKETALFLKRYLAYDRAISRVVVNTWQIFHEMDLSELPEGVRLEFSPTMPQLTFQYYCSYFYTMFSDIPHYSFYHFSIAKDAQPNDGGDYALYVGPLYNGLQAPLFANPVLQIYKVHYRATETAPFFAPQGAAMPPWKGC